MKKWNFSYTGQSESAGYSQKAIIDILLRNRGIREEDRREFLSPSLSHVSLTRLGVDRTNVEKAFLRIREALRENESIVVYMDYDADGICAGAIIWEVLYSFGARAMPYIGHRVEEGYGLTKFGIEKVKKEFDASLIITIDHGITAKEKISYAKQLGIDTIVIDHHVVPKVLPEPLALIHSTLVTAGGLAWVFCDAFIREYKPEELAIWQKQNLDLAVIATIADLAPLVGSNRAIVYHGIKQLQKTKRIGLHAMFSQSSITQEEIGTYEIGHIIVPRINAVGRLTHGIDALRLLCTRDGDRARMLAKLLHDINSERQVLTEEMTSKAIEKLEHKEISIKDSIHPQNIIFVVSEEYPQGVIGLIASKLTEKYFRPAIVVSKGNEYSKASARSIPGCNIVELIYQGKEFLTDVGGHPMAAGFTVATKHLPALKQKLDDAASRLITSDMLIPSIKVDMELPLFFVGEELFEEMKQLSPFGIGNPEPKFVCRNAEIIQARFVGREKNHLKLVVRQKESRTFEAIGFGMGNLYSQPLVGKSIDFVYTIQKNTWQNKTSLQLKLFDVTIH